MEENVKTNNHYGVHYDSARIVRILVFFEPAELEDDDFTFDPDGNDNDVADIDNIPDPDVNDEQEAIDLLVEEEAKDATKEEIPIEGGAIDDEGEIQFFFSTIGSAMTTHKVKRKYNS
jgi:hypothetical protein